MTQDNYNDGDSVEVIDSSALATLTRSEVDIQIATAHRYPRSVQRSINDAKGMATLDIPTAASMAYALPRKEKGGGTKMITGASVRLAEIFASTWGNLRIAARVIEETDKFIVAQGICHDLEKNLAISTEVRRRITYTDGRKFSDDMVIVTMNAALAIARRNAIIQVVPRVYVEQVLLAAQKTAAGDSATLNQRREKLVAWIVKTHNLPLGRVAGAVGRTRVEDITLDDLVTLNGLCTSIKEGSIKVDDAFPEVDATKATVEGSTVKPPASAPKPRGKAADLADKIGGGKAPDAPPPTNAKPTTPPPTPAVPPGVDPTTGEVIDGEVINGAADDGRTDEERQEDADAAAAFAASQESGDAGDAAQGNGEAQDEPQGDGGNGEPAVIVKATPASTLEEFMRWVTTTRPVDKRPDAEEAYTLAMKREMLFLGGRWAKLTPEKRAAKIKDVEAGLFPWG